MCSHNCFEDDFGDNLEGENILPGIKYGHRQGSEGE